MSLWSRLISGLYPIYCLGCGIDSQSYICKACHRTLKGHPEICPICHKFSTDYQVCIGCRQHSPLQGIIIGFHYHSIIKKAILKIKYHHIYDIASFFAHKLSLLIKTNPSIQADIIHSSRTLLTFVPSHWTRKYFVKGYNQSEVIAHALVGLTGYPCIPVLYKHKKTQSQAKLKRNQRLNNLIGAFALEADHKLDGQETVIIVDDVTTTGATIQELARSIHDVYPQIKIWGLVIARHVS